MENPASPPAFRRSCPACNRPVEPGYNFCETCGTPIKELPTCSKCGTQFIAPVKFCEVCGALVMAEEGAEPSDSGETLEEYSEEEGPEGEESPEPDSDELAEDREEEIIVAAEDESPPHSKGKIQEPDTDE